MAVTRTPPKAATAEAEASAAAVADTNVISDAIYNWPLIVDGQQKFVRVNADQHEYLSLPTTTTEQQTDFLRRIFDAQEVAAAAAAAAEDGIEATTAAKPTTTDGLHTRTSSPSSLDTVAEITNRTKIIEESLKNNPDVKGLFVQDENNNNNDDGGKLSCEDRRHIFEHRTKTHLSAPAKKFVRAVNALKYQLNRANFSDEVSIQFGNDLLTDVKENFVKVEEAREYCLEVLEEGDRQEFAYYMKNKLEDLFECERIHRQYFEKALQDKIARSQLQVPQPPLHQIQPPQLGSFLSPPVTGVEINPNVITTSAANILPNIMTSTPFHQNAIPPIGTQFDQMFGHAHGQHHEQRQQQNPPPGAHADPTFGQHHQSNPPGFQSNPFNQPPGYGNNHHHHGQTHGHQQQNPPPGFEQHHGQDQQNQAPGTHNGPGFGQPYSQPGPQQNFNIYEDQDLDAGSRNPTPIAPSVIDVQHHTRFKLNEELSLVETWDGSQPRAYMAFRAQWTNFVDKMTKSQRSNLDLYYALLKVLDGAARDLVHTKYPNDQSYGQAIKKLDDLFFNPTNILRDLIHNLLKGQKMVDTYQSLLSGITKLMDAWNDLNHADLSKDQLKGLLFIAATEKNLSEDSWRCWLEVQNDPRYLQNPMQAFEIQAYLGSINKAMQNAQKRKNAIGAKETNNDAPSKPAKPAKRFSTLYGSYSNAVRGQGSGKTKTQQQEQARGPNDTCVICGQSPHRYQLNCPKLKEMTPNQIYKVMTNFGIECQMCLGLNHRTRECPATRDGFLKKCTVQEGNSECGWYHCRALHKPKKFNDESTYQIPSKSKPE